MNATDTRIHNAATGKSADIRAEKCNGAHRFMVIFGSLLRNGEFQVSHAQPSRMFKTEAGATKAAQAWIS
jgi:hypothetical protein